MTSATPLLPHLYPRLYGPRLYGDLAPFWHLFSAPEDYAVEAGVYLDMFGDGLGEAPRHVLELGSGGGNTASHMSKHCAMTLVDLSEAMLVESRKLNPACEHVVGDMRSVRLERRFDAVLVHDAVMYMTTEDDLRRAMETAWVHCKNGGVALFIPDYVKETFMPATDTGGNDGEGGRAVRYIEWSYDPDPNDATYEVDYAIVLREPGRATRVVHDHHVEGLFSRDVWMKLLSSVGFESRMIIDPWSRESFIARRAK